MIYYDGGWNQLCVRLFRCTQGSLLPKALGFAMLPAAAAAVLQITFPDGTLSFFAGEQGVLRETQAWSGFSFLVGFLIVFRTSQAYSRFWEGCTASHQMRAEWFDACSSVVSFTKYSKTAPRKIRRFKELLIRLTSMLHAAALAELEKGEQPDTDEVWAHAYEQLDPQSIDSESLEVIKTAEDRVELIFEWIQQLIIENIDTGVLSVPAPLLSRSFQELATGMVQFHNAMKIAYIPIPFPYAQTCDLLLIMHSLIVPVVTSQWVTNYIWAAIFTLIQVLVLWSLNLVACEIENPFGKDANDMDGQRMQEEMNRHLLLLVAESTERTPRLSSFYNESTLNERAMRSCFNDVLAAEKRKSVAVGSHPLAGFQDDNCIGLSSRSLPLTLGEDYDEDQEEEAEESIAGAVPEHEEQQHRFVGIVSSEGELFSSHQVRAPVLQEASELAAEPAWVVTPNGSEPAGRKVSFHAGEDEDEYSSGHGHDCIEHAAGDVAGHSGVADDGIRWKCSRL